MLTHWSTARELLDLLGKLVKEYDDNGVDLYFTSPFTRHLKVKTTTQLISIFDRHKPYGSEEVSDMSARLSDTVTSYQKALAKIHERKSLLARTATKIRKDELCPLSLYIFTDAVWQPVCDVAPVIKSLVNTLNQQNLHKQQIGIQFIRFGDQPKYIRRLEKLDRLKLTGYVDM